MRLMTLDLQDGIMSHWIWSASHPFKKSIPLASWIQMMYYEGVILFQHLQKANAEKLSITYHIVPKIVKTTCYTMLDSRFWQSYHEHDTDQICIPGFLIRICSCDIIGAWVLAISTHTRPLPTASLTIQRELMLWTINIPNYQMVRITMLQMWMITCTMNWIIENCSWKTVTSKVERMWRVTPQMMITTIMNMIWRIMMERYMSSNPIHYTISCYCVMNQGILTFPASVSWLPMFYLVANKPKYTIASYSPPS